MAAGSYRIYYDGVGEPLEISEDRGKTWIEVRKCKSISYNGSDLTWPPPGCKVEWKRCSVKVPGLFLHGDPDRPMVQHNRSIPVAVEGGEMDSYLDLSPDEVRIAFKEKNRVGLVPEGEYQRKLTPAQLRDRAEKLLALAEEKEDQ